VQPPKLDAIDGSGIANCPQAARNTVVKKLPTLNLERLLSFRTND